MKVILGSFQVWVRRLGNLKNSRRFYFEKAWAMDEECRKIIGESWGVCQGQGHLKEVMDKLAECAFSDDGWVYKKYGKIKKI